MIVSPYECERRPPSGKVELGDKHGDPRRRNIRNTQREAAARQLEFAENYRRLCESSDFGVSIPIS